MQQEPPSSSKLKTVSKVLLWFFAVLILPRFWAIVLTLACIAWLWRKGTLQPLVDRFRDGKQKTKNKGLYRTALLEAVNDGKLTKEEIRVLDAKKAELGLEDEDVKAMRAEVFATAFIASKEDSQVTKEEEEELVAIQKYLKLDDVEIQSNKKELMRLRLLNEIQQGNIPTITVSNLMTQKSEKVYWSEPAILAEEKVISRRYEGGSRGVSFRIMKGVSYRVGASRGHITNETGIVAIATGDLILTSKRIIFRGDKKSFSVNLDKVLDLQLFTNGFIFSEVNKAKPKQMKFVQEGNNDIIGGVLSYAINHYADN